MPTNQFLESLFNLLGNLGGWIALGMAVAATMSKSWIIYGSFQEGLFERCIINTGNCVYLNGAGAFVYSV